MFDSIKARRKTVFQVNAYDGHFRERDRMPNLSNHRISEGFDTKAEAIARLDAWLSGNPPQEATGDGGRSGGMTANAYIEERRPSGGGSTIARVSSRRVGTGYEWGRY